MPDWLKLIVALFAAFTVCVGVWIAPGYLVGSIVSLDLNPSDWEVWVRAVSLLVSFSVGSAFAILSGGLTFAAVVGILD
jgi:hypothetical protein